jgi:rhamnosyl/mannosyltransferase
VGESCARSDTERDGYRIVKVPRFAKIFSAPLSWSFHSTFTRLADSANIVHLHAPYPPAELSLLLARLCAKVVVTYHFDVVRQRIVSPVYHPVLHAALGRADRIVCSNPNLAATSPVLSAHHEKVTVIPFGIDPGRLHLSSEEELQVHARRSAHKRPVALFVGRLVYYKGVEYLVRAAARADLDVVIVGNGPLEESLRSLAAALGLTERVRFMPHVPWHELKLLYHTCDVFVLPSVARSEAFGLVLLEAMSAGKPLVTTELGTGTSWINQHGSTGLVVAPRNPDALGDAMRRLATDHELARRFGSAARARVLTNFSDRQFKADHLRVYASLTEPYH